MPRRSGVTGPPNAHVASGPWPDAGLTDDAPSRSATRWRSRTCCAQLEDRTITDIADEAGLAHFTLHDLVTGRTLPDLVTLAKLEQVLHTRLWPDRP